MPAIIYTVTATFPDDALADEWFRWSREGHVAAVLRGGATSAEIVALDMRLVPTKSDTSFRPARHSRSMSARAARLRCGRGLRLFPVEKGIHYRRSTGVLCDTFPRTA